MMNRRFVLAGLLVLLLIPWGSGVSSAGSGARQDGCGDPATPIHVIQGSGERTPESGQKHTIEGVVVADFQDRYTELGGFFVQEEDADADSDPLTSEGIFVDSSLSQVDVAVGDVVRVAGSAFEKTSDGVSLTQLRRVSSLVVCDSGASVTPAAVTLPVDAVADWERYEGMLVSITQPLTVTENYNLGRYGEVLLASGGRLYVPTNVALPGDPALAVKVDNDRRRILLDDGNSEQNRDPTAYPQGGLSASHTLRAGDAVTGLTGVVDQAFGVYRIQATEPVEFEPTNARAAAPDAVGGTVRVASFNVLNYFNGDGVGGGFPTPRGANDIAEFERQRAKILAALLALDADVIGLMEIENDGDGPDSAVADLVNGLNEAAGEGTYAYIPDPVGQQTPDEGGDEIKQAILYRPAVVTPVGDPVTTTEPPFGSRRPPVVQAFEVAGSGERFTVAVNHFKSKNCEGAATDPDEGQGCWNRERTQAAAALTAWLVTDPTGSGDPDVLIIGDLNSYAMEDPVQVIEAAGYVNLLKRFQDDADYSYVYMGESGTLDHLLASDSLAGEVTGATTWHINADEPRVLDYNEEYKSANQVETFYSPDPYRASDHDPALVGLDLGGSGENGEAGKKISDSTGGTLAIIVGLIAVVIAMVGGWFVERGKSKVQ
jgi:predicted extracellular nuclease